MINEIIIYSDGTVNSFDSDNCQIPSASGDWSLLPLIKEWATTEFPSTLPEECRLSSCRCFIGVRKKDGDVKIPIPLSHVFRMAKYIGTTGFYPKSAIKENEDE